MSALASLVASIIRPRAATISAAGVPLSQTPGRIFSVGPTASGVEVSEDSSLSFDAVFCAVEILSDDVKILPFQVFERTGERMKRQANDHPAHRLITRRANPEMSARRFRKLMETWRKLWGNGYAEIERSRGGGKPVALWPIHPSRVRVVRNDRTDAIEYHVTRDFGSVQADVIPAADMFHIMGYSRDGLAGMSVIQFARECIGGGLAAERFGQRFFGNGAHPGGFLKVPGVLTETARDLIIKSFEERHSGGNAMRPGILEQGMDWAGPEISNEDSQFLESRQFSVTQIARWFNIPPHKLKDLSKATFSNIEQQQLEYVIGTLMGMLVDWETEADLKLIDEKDRDRFFTKFNLNAMLRGDSTARSNFYKTLWGIGAVSINDIRDDEDENSIGPAGDVYYIPMNMTTAQQMLENPPKPGKDGGGGGSPPGSQSNPQTGDKSPPGSGNSAPLARAVIDIETAKVAAMPVFVAAIDRVLRKEIKAVSAAIAKHAGDAAALGAWAAKFHAEHLREMGNAIAPCIAMLARVLGRDAGNCAAEAHAWLGPACGKASKQIHTATTPEQLETIMAALPGQMAEQVTNLIASAVPTLERAA